MTRFMIITKMLVIMVITSGFAQQPGPSILPPESQTRERQAQQNAPEQAIQATTQNPSPQIPPEAGENEEVKKVASDRQNEERQQGQRARPARGARPDIVRPGEGRRPAGAGRPQGAGRPGRNR